MNNQELRTGNAVLSCGEIYFIDRGEDLDWLEFDPIPLTEEWLLRFGFKPIPHMTVMNSLTYDIGRDRVISIGCVGTPNEMIFLIEDYSKRVPSQDICVLRNFDYDGRTYVHTLQNIVFSITGKELVSA